ncbi:Protoporphyrinogen oxidase [Flexibacter flexilis DSM 6793]|uniref:Protoporphyrinogen oxidase n=1 Tax=Flexibacter flexilis DSM 6793 TaxID=927664 RepID=A0A1I1G4H7_9BACT|nr:FAD-dependent oxidoreductase [Flexibacter flexilis]SFC04203.1 Protoporphyrinogen oxidase [Flexibacter flexilis DSM 6793]
MKQVAVIGAGVSGLSVARMLQSAECEVTVWEQADKVGGLVKCDRVHDNLFHKVGGHVFNSRNKAVLDWFWGQFDQENEFIKARRNAKILMNDKIIGYPVENYLHQLPKQTVENILSDMLALRGTDKKPQDYPNFEEFLRSNFGQTLYELYFKPYNYKIWHTDLAQVPLGWLDGKLPMPNLKQMLLSNIVREEESTMVHASFFYPREGGSQFIANRLAEGLNIWLNTGLHSIERDGGQWLLNEEVTYDEVVYCGDVRKLASLFVHPDAATKKALEAVTALKSNGTSNLFCETDATDISWLYLPNAHIKAHRIIYTGNFSETNSRGSKRSTCVVEFSGDYTYEQMCEEIKKLPGNLSPISQNHEANSYVIQETDTRERIQNLKNLTEPNGLYLLGRFAEWEYYNMDAAIEAAMALSGRILA